MTSLSTHQPTTGTTTPSEDNITTTTSFFTTNNESISVTVTSTCCLEDQLVSSTSTSTQLPTEKATVPTSQNIFTTTHHFEDYEFEEHYSIPISILLVNFILITVLMITIGLAVYPFIKRYWENCDYNFNCNRSNRYWIEDTEQVPVLSTTSSTNSSFALLQHNELGEVADNNSNSMSLEQLTEVQICDLETSSLINNTVDQVT